MREFHLDLGGPEAEKTPLGSVPDNLDQTPKFDPADSEPVPDDDFDLSRTTWQYPLSAPLRWTRSRRCRPSRSAALRAEPPAD